MAPVCGMTEYMVIETFAPGRSDAVYERLRDRGRMLPEGLEFVQSWLSRDQHTCFQLMRTARPELFETWFEHWRDLVSFELVELGPKPE